MTKMHGVRSFKITETVWSLETVHVYCCGTEFAYHWQGGGEWRWTGRGTYFGKKTASQNYVKQGSEIILNSEKSSSAIQNLYPSVSCTKT